MRTKTGLCASGCAALAVIVLVLAGTGSAASPSICATSGPKCISESVAPHFLTATNPNDPATWNEAVATTRFTNGSGSGGATATHTALSVTFTALGPQTRHFVTINALTDASGASVAGNCTTTWTNDPTVTSPAYNATLPTTVKVTCSYGSTAGGQTVKLHVRFATDTSMNVAKSNANPVSTLITGSVTYGESGNDNPTGPNGTVNDNQTSADSLTVGGFLQGDCFDTSTATVTGATTTQATTATVGQAADAGLPCTPVSAGVDPNAPRPGTFRDVSFAEFPALAGGAVGTVVVDYLTALPKGFVLKELTNPLDPTNPLSWAEVKKCGVATTLDSCIASTKNLPKGGFRYILSVAGSDIDPRYSG